MYNKLLLYTAVLRPILTYGSPVWGYAADSNIKILEVAQNSLIRNITSSGHSRRNCIEEQLRSCNHAFSCHVRSTNKDTLSQAGPPTSGHINSLDMGWRNASRSISQWHPASSVCVPSK
ncbi:hypothetical protein TNCV_1641521 [Trichonephila clavipes]|nr:hypothetical protein TNCV_1641521 [Trichonephila clavipes]